MQPTQINPLEISIHPSNAEWERLLGRVIESTPFRRSARLRDFLIYVGNEVVIHGAEDVHEQQIGTAVFGRSPSYDTSQDNIVRVNAMELRKRLDLYFSSEGKAEPLVFEIPRGSYVPVFRPRQLDLEEQRVERAAIVDEITTFPDAPVQVAPPVAPPLRRYPAAFFRNPAQFGMLLVILSLSVWLIMDAKREQQMQTSLHKWQGGPALRAFWGNFFGQKLAPEIVLADTSYGISQDILNRRLSLGQYLDYSYRAAEPEQPLSTEARQQQKKDLAVLFSRDTGSIGDFRVARRITELETGDFGTRLSFAREYAGHRLRWSNTIFVGSSRSNPWVELFEDRMSYHFKPAKGSSPAYVAVDNPTGSEQAQYPISAEQNGKTAYCIVVFLPNPTNTGNTLIVAGSDSQATEAGGDFITDEKDLERLLGLLHRSDFPYFQVLLKISRSNGTPLDSEVISSRILKK